MSQHLTRYLAAVRTAIQKEDGARSLLFSLVPSRPLDFSQAAAAQKRVLSLVSAGEPLQGLVYRV